LLTSLPGGALGFLVVVNLFVFVLAFFLDFFEIAFIVVPMLAPVAARLGIDPVWFGILLGINMQTSFLHPPFGFALFYLRSVAPREVKTADIYWGAVPFVLIQLAMVAVVLAFPGLAGGGTATNVAMPLEIKLEAAPGADYLLPPEKN
jgi:TRAP-type mannitol/chloroaromatic compound transport system permease large subunit